GRSAVVVAGPLPIPLMLLFLAMPAPLPAMVVLVPLALVLYVPSSLMVVLGQEYLPGRVGTASGVTLGLAVSVGGVLTPALGYVADQAGLRTALLLLGLGPAAAAPPALRLPRPPRPSTGLEGARIGLGGSLAPMHPISRPCFCGPRSPILRMGSLRSSAHDHDLGHLATKSLAAPYPRTLLVGTSTSRSRRTRLS